VKATPRFPAITNPHLQADLGFYDLRLPEVRAAQAELAASYGIYGFCYYHYWFNGRQVLVFADRSEGDWIRTTRIWSRCPWNARTRFESESRAAPDCGRDRNDCVHEWHMASQRPTLFDKLGA
jgi:Glycosyltransferase WbsX